MGRYIVAVVLVLVLGAGLGWFIHHESKHDRAAMGAATPPTSTSTWPLPTSASRKAASSPRPNATSSPAAPS